jgi:AcrR family transcriptional regulator
MANNARGAETRRRIVEQAAPVFNQRGYAGTSLSDLMAATGLEKGGIYNHFGSKEALALEAFDHNTGVVGDLIRRALRDVHDAPGRLHAVVDVYRSFVRRPPFPGGCPLLNTTVEADDTQPALLERARAVMGDLRDGTVGRIVAKGVERGELRAGLDPDTVATAAVAAIEGAIMLCRLEGSSSPMERTASFLHQWIDWMAEVAR